MKNTRQSITFKVFFGYCMLAVVIGLGIYLVYPQVRAFIYPPKEKKSANKKLTYISNALSLLYEAETVGRSAMATGDTSQVKRYSALTDSITVQIDSLSRIIDIATQEHQLDSIKIKLDAKTKNMQAMVSLRSEQSSRDFSEEAMQELIKQDIYFEDYENNPVLDTMKPRLKNALVDWMEYLRKDNTATDRSMKDMAETVRTVLRKVEQRKKRLQMDIVKREDVLFTNDRTISKKIRDLLTSLERESTSSAQDRERELRSKVTEVSQTLQIMGGVGIVLALGFVVMVFRDASKSQRYSTRLEESYAFTQSLLDSREQLMATITHDMRSPLNTVIGFTELLDKTRLDGKQKNYLNHVQKSSEYILRLVNDLLDFSKLEAGRVTIEKVPFNAKNLIEDIAVVALPSTIKEGVDINMEIDDKMDNFFVSDPFRIKQIVANLISNAYKFTDEGMLTIRAIWIGEKDKKICFEVQDTGIGIDREKQELIFKEFTQADQGIEQTYGGFGLGLAITKRLVDLLNGSIDLKSEVGQGSIFRVTIPVKQLPNGDAPPDTNKQEPRVKSPERILIVDDDPAQLSLAQEIVNSLSIYNETANNGREALQLADKHQYDLILTDVQMPEMDGVDLIQALRKKTNYRDVAIYALSGNGSLKPDDYRELGFTGSLRKPYLPLKLLRLITHNESEKNSSLSKHSNKIKKTKKGYTLKELKLFADQDPDSLRSILSVFITGTQENLENLNKMLKQRDCPQINKMAHKMLPMFRQLNAFEIIPILEKLESPDLDCTSKIVLNSLGKVANDKITGLLKNLEKEVKG